MLINFLTKKNRKPIITEYVLRLFIFLFVFISVATVFLISLFLPSVFFVNTKNDIVEKQLNVLLSLENPKDNPIQIIKDMNSLLKIFYHPNESGFYIGDLIKNIVSLKDKNIQISRINIVGNTKNSSKTLVIEGFSQTRDGLTSFKNKLSENSEFVSVDLPITYLINDLNNDFVITLITRDNIY